MYACSRLDCNAVSDKRCTHCAYELHSTRRLLSAAAATLTTSRHSADAATLWHLPHCSMPHGPQSPQLSRNISLGGRGELLQRTFEASRLPCAAEVEGKEGMPMTLTSGTRQYRDPRALFAVPNKVRRREGKRKTLHMDGCGKRPLSKQYIQITTPNVRAAAVFLSSAHVTTRSSCVLVLPR